MQAWQAAVELNLLSTVRLCRHVVPFMKQQHWGRIINITSVSVKQPVDRLTHFIKQGYEADPLVCPRCTGPMRIIAFIPPAGYPLPLSRQRVIAAQGRRMIRPIRTLSCVQVRLVRSCTSPLARPSPPAPLPAAVFWLDSAPSHVAALRRCRPVPQVARPHGCFRPAQSKSKFLSPSRTAVPPSCALFFLCRAVSASPLSEYITGEVIDVNGGMHID
jgi:NAD(P)-dependent dehydrogenase (short-subunit alcohol dehydrogenase family)